MWKAISSLLSYLFKSKTRQSLFTQPMLFSTSSQSSSSFSSSLPSKIYKISISPGHCSEPGQDPGAIGPLGTKEADVARVIAKALMDLFSSDSRFDAQVVGYAEKLKNYEQRVKSSDERNDNFYVPIHLNSSGENCNINGFLIFVDADHVAKNPSLKNLCLGIITELNKVCPIGFADYDSQKDGYRIGDGKAVYEETHPKADTVYIECGFISNPVWEQKVKDEGFCKQLANAIYTGFVNFVKE